MWLGIARFEIKNLFRSWTTHLFFILFFAITLLVFLGLGGAFKGASLGSVNSLREWANSSLNLYRHISMLNLFTILVVAGLMGNAVQRDRSLGTDGLMFTKPITEFQVLAGRFVGTYVVLVYIAASAGLGAFVASKTPFIEPALFGPHAFAAYLRPYLIAVLPNLFIFGAFFFAVAAASRRMFAVYSGGVVLMLFYCIATEWSTLLDHLGAAAALDPFGFFAEQAVTRYWTIAEKNTRLLPFSGLLLINRMLWLVMGLAAAAFAVRRFSFFTDDRGGATAFPDVKRISPTTTRPSATTQFEGRYQSRVLASLTKLEFWETVRSPAFLIMLLAAVGFVLAMSTVLRDHLGTRTVPVTYAVIELLGNSFAVFVVIIIAFVAGEMVWRERDARAAEMVDCTPVPTWIPPVSKMGALLLIIVMMLSILLVCCIAIQTALGYTHYEIGQYVGQFFGIKFAFFAQVAVFAVFFHTVANRKSMGHFLLLASFVLAGQVSKLGWDHYLVRLFRTPGLIYSDMNGYGHLLKPHCWFSFYWFCWSILAGLFAWLLWHRGIPDGLRRRWRVFRQRCRPSAILLLGLSATLIVAVGTTIFVNTNILNTYRSPKTRLLKWVDYEKTYAAWRARPQPKIRRIDVEVDLFPEERGIEASGHYTLENDSTVAIDQVLVCFTGSYSEDQIVNPVTIRDLTLDRPFSVQKHDLRLGVTVMQLDQALRPGERAELRFQVALSHRGFPNGVSTTRLVGNGTFVPDRMILPRIGYVADLEIRNQRIRKRYALPDLPPIPPLSAHSNRQHNVLGDDADLVSFDAIVSTSGDQIALAPGTLTDSWQHQGRAYFRYQLPRTRNFFAFLSARYAVKRDRFQDVDIEVYFHPGHERNLDVMIHAIKDTLAYCSQSFGPYQHDIIRIVEFPRYNRFAQSFATTIPFSEAAGFIAEIDEAHGVNDPYRITSHEVAHQWWAHQVMPARVEGSEMITETLANYTALMVMKHHLGEQQVRARLRHYLDEYLRGRGEESAEELPLCRATYEQAYVAYAKGVHCVVAFQDLIGESAVNVGLKRFVSEYAEQGPPYPTSIQLIDCLRRQTPPHLQGCLDDLFHHITLYDLRLARARAFPNSDTGYTVTLDIEAQKFHADGIGTEATVPIDDWLDIGVFDASDQPLYLEKHRIDQSRKTITVTVAGLPARAGIDPTIKRIDRIPDDNAGPVAIKPAPKNHVLSMLGPGSGAFL